MNANGDAKETDPRCPDCGSHAVAYGALTYTAACDDCGCRATPEEFDPTEAAR